MIPFPQIDPVAVHLGPLAIRWYGLAYLAGFAFAYSMLRVMVRTGRLRLTTELLTDLIGWLAVGVMVGGRLGWWLFYHRAYGAIEPWYEVFALWHGGMSFHGGLLGVTGALLFWCSKRKAPFWNVADCLALVVPVGLFLGRIANFINAELVGRPTGLPWGVVFPGESIARHPSQLYEALLEGPVLFVLLWIASRRPRRNDGFIAALFLVFYGVLRFAAEFARQPDDQIGFVLFSWITMGQVLSIALALFGAMLLLVGACKSRSAGSSRQTGGEEAGLTR